MSELPSANIGQRTPGGQLQAGPAACPACESRDNTQIGRKGSLVLWRCRSCTVVFTHPQPTLEVERRYLEEYDLATHFDEVAPRKHVLFARRLELLNEAGRGAGSRLCDVGCAGGQFLELAREEGWKPFGIEMNPPAAQRARDIGTVVFEGALEQLDALPWGTFDVVTSWDVLEHTPNPRMFTERLSQLVAPDGLLVMTTLNWNAIVRLALGMRWSMIVQDHFTYWTEYALRRLVEREHLTFLRAESFGLGRDLVRPLDRLAAASRSMRPRKNGAGVSALPHGPGWDTHAVTLRAEAVVNRLLSAAGAGVGLLAMFRARP